MTLSGNVDHRTLERCLDFGDVCADISRSKGLRRMLKFPPRESVYADFCS